MQGLLNGAPYLCSAVIGCWMNAPLNKAFGRRGTIFISCFISFVTGFWMAAADRCVLLRGCRYCTFANKTQLVQSSHRSIRVGLCCWC